jgi:lipoprotein signal peptidase
MPAVTVKRSMPSLIGGIFTAIAVFVLWLLLFGTDSVVTVALGIIVAGGLGTWIRLADL